MPRCTVSIHVPYIYIDTYHFIHKYEYIPTCAPVKTTLRMVNVGTGAYLNFLFISRTSLASLPRTVVFSLWKS